MRRSVVLWGLAAALALGGGCERTEPVDEPRVYDPAIDAPPSTIRVDRDPLLLANQVEIAKRAPKPAAPRPSAGAPEASRDSIEGVKTALLRMLDAVEAGQTDAVVNFFVSEDAAAMQPVLAASPALKTKWETLARLVRDKLGVELPPQQVQMMVGQEKMGVPAWMDRTTLMAEPSPLQFLTQGDKVVVSRKGQEPVTLVQVGGAWKVQLTPQERAMVGLAGEMVKASGTIADTLISGINGGTITKENFPAQVQAQVEAHLTPILAKVEAAVAAAGSPAGAGGTLAAAGGTGAGATPTAAGELPVEPVSSAGGELLGPNHLEAVTSLWLANDRDQALGGFVQIDWTKPAAFSAGSAYGMSVLRFAILPQTQRDALTEATALQIKALKELTTRLSEIAARYASASDEPNVRKCVQAMAGCAKVLQQPTHLPVVREAGAAIAQLANARAPGGEVVAPVSTGIARPGEGPVDPGYLEIVATLWALKEKDQALKEFLRIDWATPAVLEPGSVLLMVDREILAMPGPQRDLKLADATGLDRAVRELSQYVLTQARTTHQGPDAAKAKRYTDALASLSSYLQQPQYLLVFQERGRTIASMDNPITGAPIGMGTKPPANVVPPPAPAAPPSAAAPRAAEPEADLNAGRGPEAAQELKNRLLAPARRATGGGN